MLAAATLGLAASPLGAQSSDRDPSIENLPRPGYEPRTIILGKTVIQPTIDADVTYDDNILATRTRRDSDAIFSVRPRITAERSDPSLALKADAHANVIRYADNSRENVETFGGFLDASKTIAANQSVTANLAFDRTFQRRSDPEAELDRTRPPALINLATGTLQYRYRGARIGILADASVSKLDYLPAADDDRDLTTWRASLRTSLNLSPRIAVYVEPFVNRRDFRVTPVRGSYFGDTTTMGALLGVSFDLRDTLQGHLGAGVFSANPDAEGAKSFTGVALSGRLVWRPRVRTAMVLDVFRGDVATVRAGSLGRIDTRIALAIDQEVRHNLILHVAGGVRDVRYRGGIDNNQRYYSASGEARYLLDRHLSLTAGATYTRRTAKVPDERFNRFQATLGLRVTY